MDYFFVSYYFIYLMAQLVPHWWGMFFTQQTLCLPYVFLTYSSWYIGIYTVDTLLYSLCFTNCIILFLPLLLIHPWVFTWVLQPELLFKVIILDVTNFIWPYLHQFFDNSHSLNGSWKPLKRPFDRYQLCLEAINNGRDIRQINR